MIVRTTAAALALTLASFVASAQPTASASCPFETTAPPEVGRQFDALLARFVDPEAPTAGPLGVAPGAVLRVEAPDWVYHGAVGVADVASGAPLDCTMPFEIGSNTKTMTAVAFLQLHEAGRLDVDAPLADYLPEYASALPFGERMTLRQLATHTAGVFSYTDDAPNGAPGLMEGALTDPAMLELGYAPADLVAFVVENGEPTFEPGAPGAWSYSNTGYILLGLVIERVTGRPLAEVFRERIFDPLGMRDTFLWNDVPRPEFGLPSAYYQAPFELDTSAWNLSQGWAAGGVISTARDMNTFVRALFGGELFRDDATLELMMDGVDTGGAGFLRYGFGLGEKLPGVWGHGGQTLGFESDLAYLPEDGVSIVVWTNAARDLAVVGAVLVDGVLVEAGLATDPNRAEIVGTEWRWAEFQSMDDTTLAVPEPAAYTLRLDEDGTLRVRADCNRASGTYVLDAPSLDLAPTTSTRAACAPDSLSERYLTLLGFVVSYVVDDGDLYLSTLADGGILRFEAGE